MKTGHVSFKDYEHDTRELAERAATIIANQKYKIDRLEREGHAILWAMVRAAGGHLFVPNGALTRGVPKEWRIERDDAKNGTHYRVIED